MFRVQFKKYAFNRAVYISDQVKQGKLHQNYEYSCFINGFESLVMMYTILATL